MTTRTVSIYSLYNDSLLTPDREVYQPGTLEDLTIAEGYIYSGIITKLDINTSIRTFHEFDVWAEDSNGNRYNLLTRIRISPSVKVFDVLERLSATKKAPFSGESKLGITLLTPERWINGDSVTITGFAEETAYEVLGNNNPEATVDLTYQRSATKPLTRVDESPLQQGDEWFELNTGMEWFWEATLERWLSKQVFLAEMTERISLSGNTSYSLGLLQEGYDYYLQRLLGGYNRISHTSSRYYLIDLNKINTNTEITTSLFVDESLGTVSGRGTLQKQIQALLPGSEKNQIILRFKYQGSTGASIDNVSFNLSWRLVKI